MRYLITAAVMLCVMAGSPESTSKEAGPPNILLIVIDAARYDHLHCYGYGRGTSPFIDKLAGDGMRFTQAISAAGWTAESLPCLFTGTYAAMHTINYWNRRLNPHLVTLPIVLKEKKYNTFLVSDHLAVGKIDLVKDFDWTFIGDCRGTDEAELTEQLIKKIKSKRSRPFFAYVHYYGCHVPYRNKEPFKSMYLQDRFRVEKNVRVVDRDMGIGGLARRMLEKKITDMSYYVAQHDAAITRVDAEIERLTKLLDEADLARDTLIIITADHGEMLGEHDIYFSHFSCYEPNIRIPLILYYPSALPAGVVIERQVSSVDIVPTILELAGIDVGQYPYMSGRSLLAFLEDRETVLHPYVYVSYQADYCVRSEEWKLIQVHDPDTKTHSSELYYLQDDPEEACNLAKDFEEKAGKLRTVLKRFHVHAVPSKETEPLTEEDREDLRSLGYL